MKKETRSLRESWQKDREKDSVRMPGNNILKYPFSKKLFGFNTEDSYGYELRNSMAFRCDEFSKDHDGKHILFSGCSVTFGSGLELKETWAHKLYSKISEKEKVSGYYNLGVPGTGIFFMVSNLFKYFNKYGNPDIIFLNLTDLLRFYGIDEFGPDIKRPFIFKDIVDLLSKKVYHDQDWSEEQDESTFARWVNYYDYLMMLESYCKTNNIKLFIFSYAGPTNETFNRVELECFYDIDPIYIIDQLIEYAADNDIGEHFLTARDGMHEGYGLHERWAERLFEIYSKESNNVN